MLMMILFNLTAYGCLCAKYAQCVLAQRSLTYAMILAVQYKINMDEFRKKEIKKHEKKVLKQANGKSSDNNNNNNNNKWISEHTVCVYFIFQAKTHRIQHSVLH